MNTLYSIRLLEVSISVLTAAMTTDGGGGGGGDGDDGNEAPVSLEKKLSSSIYMPIEILFTYCKTPDTIYPRRFHVTIAAVAVCRSSIIIYVARFMLASSTPYKSYNVSADF